MLFFHTPNGACCDLREIVAAGMGTPCGNAALLQFKQLRARCLSRIIVRNLVPFGANAAIKNDEVLPVARREKRLRRAQKAKAAQCLF